EPLSAQAVEPGSKTLGLPMQFSAIRHAELEADCNGPRTSRPGYPGDSLHAGHSLADALATLSRKEPDVDNLSHDEGEEAEVLERCVRRPVRRNHLGPCVLQEAVAMAD
ncbi:unnamed protein product, partial [Effrenium voratum]